MTHNLLKGKRGIIFGALNEESIAWKVAEKAAEEGATIALSNTAMALRMGTLDKLAEQINAPIIAADATSVEDLEKVFIEAQEKLGGKIDFVLHSVAMSPNVRKHRTYDDLDYNFLNKTLDISAISFHKMLQVAKKLDAINEWGSVVALTYVASQRTFFGYNDMADAKSMLESIARSFGYIYGREKHVRINTISQSPTATTAGKGIKDIENMMDFADKMSPLGNAVAEDCANYCVMMFSDFTRQAMTDYGYYLLKAIKSAYDGKQQERYATCRDAYLQLMLDLDELLCTNSNFMLGRWTQMARGIADEVAGTTEADRQWLELNNARTLITTWGNRNSSEWGGLPT